ncbi:hypothetical protein UAY_01283 [Enterococcus moraviensis ATCC BAA-383]|uniref:PRD domain-containing protein n=1 Tax=Enterococcus moraviensis ATCC BAA-383 TaxID=1158609 RepID=R2QZA3_9ENTE|nr:PRD domain-containing protein [Enterococcus moraviensis]EOI01875.1 hypothetical protein UAY_01283 [Enterococcus moraviensis ATCC BAA-383]EOT73590.1 hypothetical protein I586_00584 [Enterococcus moraviensis ATCC BAA-383]OJG69151.1 hypothetical protein RV09_GL000550 [Enterococcus moraviensis]OTP47320.1 hypothetical protein A5881_003326 [Enterococcus termitis]
MIIQKILNNNVVVCLDNLGNEIVVLGKGLAYQKKIGEAVEDSLVNKKFVLQSQDLSGKFQQIIASIPSDFLSVTDEIIENIKLKLGKKLSEGIYISLTDHIYTSIHRKQQGIAMKNAMLWDIKRFYPVEFQLGQEAIILIKQRLDVQLSEDEAGFIAFHIVNSELDENLEHAYEVTKLMTEILSIVKYHFNVTIDEDSVYFYRFITHLKFLAQRIFNGTLHVDGEDSLFLMVKETYPSSFECTEKITMFLKKKHRVMISKEEKSYLTIHLDRLIYKKNTI